MHLPYSETAHPGLLFPLTKRVSQTNSKEADVLYYEERLIGSLLVTPAGLAAVRRIVTPESFAPGLYRQMYAGMLALSERGDEITTLTLPAELAEREGEISRKEWLTFCLQAAEPIVDGGDAEFCAQQVASAGRTRQRQADLDTAQTALNRVQVQIDRGDDPERAIGDLQSAVAGLAPTLDGAPAPIVDWPEPAGEAAYIGLVGDVCACIAPHTEAQPIAVLVHFLAAFGSAVGAGPHMMVGATRHSVRDNYLLVGRTSKSRKGDSFSPVKTLFALADPAWTKDRIISGLSSGEGVIWAVRDPIYKTVALKEKGRHTGEHQQVLEDPGEADKRVLIVESEFARVLKAIERSGSTLSPVIREAWDTGTLRILTKNSPVKATGAHLNAAGHITNGELRRELTATEAANGFANRFIFVAVKRGTPRPSPKPFKGPIVEGLGERLRETLNWGARIGEMERDNECERLWCEIYENLSREQDGLVGAILARAEAHVLRLSLVYALLDRSAVVCVRHLLAALEVWAYSERSVQHIFGDATGDPIADTIYEAMVGSGEMTRWEMTNLLGRNVASGRIDHALVVLERTGRAKPSKRQTDGRPAEVWTARSRGVSSYPSFSS